jgi:hypothetical protein
MKETELKAKIAELNEEMEQLEPARAKYYKLSHERSKLVDELQYLEKRSKLRKAEMRTNYIPCEYPSIGIAGANGSATFASEEQMDNLVAALNSNSSYYNHYKGIWSEPGDYIMEPDYRRDHDGDIVYTATFKKA